MESNIIGAAQRANELTRDENFVTATKQMQARLGELDPKGKLGITPPKIMEAFLRFGHNGVSQEVLEQTFKLMSADRHTTFEEAMDLAEKELKKDQPLH